MTTPRASLAAFYPLFLLFLIIASGLILYADALADLFSRWTRQPEYSHGLIIPLISAYLLWERRKQLSPSISRLNLWSVLLICIAMFLLFVGEISALYILIHYSLWLFLLALALAILGPSVKYSLAPLALLLFAIPLPYYLEAAATSNLQLLSSQIGVAVIRLFQVPVFLSGNIIDLGNVKLHVVEACSGLRYLFPLASLGFVMAYFYRAKLWLRVLVFFSSIPITILLNSARIGMTGVISEYISESYALGFLHNFEAWFFFLLCVGVLLSEIKIIEYFTLQRALTTVFATPAIAASENSKQRPLTRNWSLLLITPLLLSALLVMHKIEQREEVTPDNQSLASFPMTVNGWQGSLDFLDQEIIDGLQFSDYFLANYRHENFASDVNFYLAYYENQRKGASPHSPKVCIPGGGWEITEFSRIELAGIPVNRAVIEMGLQQQLVYYWFVERGQVVASEYVKKWLLLTDSLKFNRSDGALVRVVIPVDNLGGMEAAQTLAIDFIQHIQPVVSRYLPSHPEKGFP